MKEADASEGLGTFDTLRQVAFSLGFHDLLSFLLVIVFVVLAGAFIISFAVFLVKKRRERLDELNRIVTELQTPANKPVIEQQKNARAPDKHAEPDIIKPLHKPFAPSVPPIEVRPKEPLSIKPEIKVEIKPEVKAEIKPEVKDEIRPEPKLEAPILEEQPVSKESLIPVETKIEPVALSPQILIQDTEAEKQKLETALKNTRNGFLAKLAGIFSRKPEISEEDFEEIEAVLFTADIGAKTAQKLLDLLRDRVKQEKHNNKQAFFKVLKEEMLRILESVPQNENLSKDGPRVIMFVGVNGAGKTTTIGKLGAKLVDEGKKIVFGAGDTYRAAAKSQLSIWGDRASATVVTGKENADSASVLFDAIEQAKKAHADVVLCDTAGRLHTKTSLMDELKKVHRVVAKAQAGAPHDVYLVIDATMGQNAIAQAREFAAATPLTGIILSKLDGTAKGGVAIGMVDELKIPIRYMGIGEQVGDLKDFDAGCFVDALFAEV